MNMSRLQPTTLASQIVLLVIYLHVARLDQNVYPEFLKFEPEKLSSLNYGLRISRTTAYRWVKQVMEEACNVGGLCLP